MKNVGSLLRIIFCLGILILLGFKGQAQERKAPPVLNLNGGTAIHYQNAYGIRLGNQFGLSGKRFVHNGDFIEAIVGTNFDRKGIVGTLLYEWHRNAFQARNMYWFYGGGAHVGYYQYKNYYSSSNERHHKDGNFVEFGADAIIGLEYGLSRTPITFGLDAKPYLNLVGGDTGGVDVALSVRYVF